MIKHLERLFHTYMYNTLQEEIDNCRKSLTGNEDKSFEDLYFLLEKQDFYNRKLLN